MRFLASVICAVGMFLGSVSYAVAQYDDNCKGGSALRQTIVLVDEKLVANQDLRANSRWTVPLLKVLDAGETSQNTILPSEKLLVLSFRPGSGELAPIFDGCSPNLSARQVEELRKEDSLACVFFGCDSSAKIASRREIFRDSLLSALNREIGSVTERSSLEAKFPRSLERIRNLINLSRGIPRVFILADGDSLITTEYSSEPQAKAAGLRDGFASNVDLARAEIYIMLFGTISSVGAAYLEGFFLASKGYLFGIRSDGLPVVALPPSRIDVYGGTVTFGEVDAPIQIRIAADAEGNLVNSWVEITTGRSVSTPISGKLICSSATECVAKGDGRLMGQVWNPDQSGEPKFDPEFGWSGLRYFEMTLSDGAGQARIFDPKVKLTVSNSDGTLKELDEWKFNVGRLVDQEF